MVNLLFSLFHWQYARADEVDKLRQDYQDGINTLKMFMDATNEKMTAPVQVSFLNVRAFVQDVEVNSPYTHPRPQTDVSALFSTMKTHYSVYLNFL